MPRLDAFNARRRELARHYLEQFGRVNAALGCGLPPADFENSNWHMFQITLPVDDLKLSRGDFIRAMAQRGLGVGVHYPALHLFSAYRRLGFRDGQFPRAERIGREIVTLPLFPAMTETDVERVVGAVSEIIQQHKK
ncbi:MAG: beta-eliminating lyase family protein [Proteobacteria bacterium]|nr:beta-eliminating lyase family protein [Pseudomonadota bacterium]